LLIGANKEKYGLVVNPRYIPILENLTCVKSKLREQQALRAPGTRRPIQYKDTYAQQISASTVGLFSVADIITYKRRSGQTIKDTLVER
jgi:hypothetical protein